MCINEARENVVELSLFFSIDDQHGLNTENLTSRCNSSRRRRKVEARIGGIYCVYCMSSKNHSDFRLHLEILPVVPVKYCRQPSGP